MNSTLALFSTALKHRLRYRHGLPFITSVVLAVVTTAWPLVRDAFFHKGTSIWTFAMLASISTGFAMLCGGRYRAFFIAVAVTLDAVGSPNSPGYQPPYSVLLCSDVTLRNSDLWKY